MKIYWRAAHVMTVAPLGPEGNAMHGVIRWKAEQEEVWSFLLDFTEPQQGPGRDDYPESFESGWTMRIKGKQPVDIDVPGVDIATNTVAWREVD